MRILLTLVTLLLSGVHLLAQDNDALIAACGAGNLANVKTIVESGASINYKNAGGATPISSSYLWPEITEYLLSKGAEANGGDYPALVNAATFYSVDVMKPLLKAGADPNKSAVVKVDVAGPMRKLLEEEKAKGKKANKHMVKAYEDQLAKMPAGNTMSFTALGQCPD
jgi:ankyrin repeat protein